MNTPSPDVPAPVFPVTRFDLDTRVPPAGELGAVHVLAVGGAGMSAVARLLSAAGLRVSGSDARDSPVVAALRSEGITVSIGHDPAHLDGVDTVVFSSAIREDNPELAAARSRGLRVLHRAQALTSLMHGRRVAAVAGANGKTTTTSMLTELLLSAGAAPSYAIGGELTEQGTNAALGVGQAFVVEADESDGSFLVYHPDVAVVTNVQPDHLDFYGTFENVEAAYARFAGTVRPGGLLVACADDPGSAALAQQCRAAGLRVLSYGTDPAADLRLLDLRHADLATRAVLRRTDRPGSPDRELRLAMPGDHNARNAAAAYLAATAGLGVDEQAALAGLETFGGVRRRFEFRGEAGGVRVVDDYAHNPGKVAAVLSTAVGLRQGGRLVAVFQPHLYSRTRDFAGVFGEALALADVVVVLDVYAAREDPMPGVSGALVARTARDAGAAEVHDLTGTAPAGLAAAIAAFLRPGDLVLTIGAGDVTDLGPELLTVLRGSTEPEVDAAEPNPSLPRRMR